MKRILSGTGIFLMLILKNPPMPEFSAFRKEHIVSAHCLSRRQIAMQYHIN